MCVGGGMGAAGLFEVAWSRTRPLFARNTFCHAACHAFDCHGTAHGRGPVRGARGVLAESATGIRFRSRQFFNLNRRSASGLARGDGVLHTDTSI